MSRPSVVLMGSKPGAVVALRVLRERGWDVRAVVDSGTDRHRGMHPLTLAEAARRAGIPVVAPADLPAVGTVDFLVSYLHRHRVRPVILGLARVAALNFHPAPLPEFAGFAFYNVAILEEAKAYGCTCHVMDDRLDTGPIVAERRFSIDAAAETAASLERRTQIEMIRLFVDVCRRAEAADPLPARPQRAELRRYLTRAQFESLRAIPPGADDDTVRRSVRAFWFPPYAGAHRNGAAVTPEAAGLPPLPRAGGADLACLEIAAGFEPTPRTTEALA